MRKITSSIANSEDLGNSFRRNRVRHCESGCSVQQQSDLLGTNVPRFSCREFCWGRTNLVVCPVTGELGENCHTDLLRSNDLRFFLLRVPFGTNKSGLWPVLQGRDRSGESRCLPNPFVIVTGLRKTYGFPGWGWFAYQV